ncbi:cell wall / vacuolar inhibitor of fructosidase 1 [Ziziphus jujuba]|uniref:Cell wall / vacuolar inhibitor of fructosidase 1 n=1 Tax=Ziziphus jujuba TaxID=326968 RepID=A0A6P3YVG5_ZIZJJ|nr:cell wall / vacuolar inhibitor of fructosidase 1 [Ziziphus jujuba]
MKKFTVSIFLVHAFFLLSLPISRCRIFPMDEKFIESTCKQTPNYDLCVSSLKSDPKSSTADVPGLALILVNKIKSQATKTLNHINSLLKRSPGAGKRRALDSCYSKYDAILKGDVPEAIEALTKGDYKFAEDGANDAANEANSCERGFSSGSSPLTAMNKYIHDVSAIAAALVRTLL